MTSGPRPARRFAAAGAVTGEYRQGSGMGRLKKVLGFSAIGLFGAVALAAGYLFSQLNHIGGDGGPLSVIDTIRNPRAYFPGKQRINILLIGKDYNYTNKNILYTKGARADTLLMLSLDLDARTASALSIPRDTYAEYPDGLPSKRDKINAAYAWGEAPLAMQTVGNLLGVYPDYYIALKPDAVKKIVDMLGGVEVVALDRMKYDTFWGNLHIDLPAGKQVINGEQAVGFTRFRKPNQGEPPSKEEGDDRRMARQQQLLRAIVQKAKQPQMLPRAGELVDATMASIETNLTRQQVLALGALFKNVEPEQIQTASLQGVNQNRKPYYFFPDQEKMTAQVDWLLRGDQAAGYRLTVVAVKNGTQVRGAAREVADLLRDQGFDAKSAGNALRTAEVDQTQILYGKAAVAPRAQRIAELLHIKAEALSKQPVEHLDGADVTIVLGKDVAPNFAPREASL